MYLCSCAGLGKVREGDWRITWKTQSLQAAAVSTSSWSPRRSPSRADALQGIRRAVFSLSVKLNCRNWLITNGFSDSKSCPLINRIWRTHLKAGLEIWLISLCWESLYLVTSAQRIFLFCRSELNFCIDSGMKSATRYSPLYVWVILYLHLSSWWPEQLSFCNVD